MERPIWGFGDGSTLPVVDTPLGRIGSVICNERVQAFVKVTRSREQSDRNRID